MSIPGHERRRSRRIRLAEMNTPAVLTGGLYSAEGTLIDYSAEGFLLRLNDAQAELPEHAELLVWGQRIAVERRHVRVDGESTYAGWQRLDIAVPPPVDQGLEAGLSTRYRASRPAPDGSLWKGLAATLVLGLGIAGVGHYVTAGAQRSDNDAAQGFYDQLPLNEPSRRERAPIVPPAGWNLPVVETRPSHPAKSNRLSPVRQPAARTVAARIPTWTLDLGDLSGLQVRQSLREALGKHDAASYRLTVHLGSADRHAKTFELDCSRNAVQKLLDDLSVNADNWADFRRSVEDLASRSLLGDRPDSNQLAWEHLRLKRTGDRTIRLEVLDPPKPKTTE